MDKLIERLQEWDEDIDPEQVKKIIWPLAMDEDLRRDFDEAVDAEIHDYLLGREEADAG